MELSKSLVDAFVKTTNDGSEKENNTLLLYGSVVEQDGSLKIKFDGSGVIAPAVFNVEAREGDRVSITIEDHTVKVVGNITAPPSSRTATNYIGHTSDGLLIGDITNDELESNVLLKSDSLEFRTGNDIVLARYAPKKIELGINSEESVIELCGGIGNIKSIELDGGFRYLGIESNGVKLTTNQQSHNDSNSDKKYIMSVIDMHSIDESEHGEITISTSYDDTNIESSMHQLLNNDLGSYLDFIVSGYSNTSSIRINHKSKHDTESYYFQGIEIATPNYVRISSSVKNSVNSIGVGVGSGGINRGLFDDTNGRWMLYCDDNDLYYQAPKQLSKTKPYYRSGDSVSVVYEGSGYTTSDGQVVRFTVPFSKHMDKNSITPVITSIDGFYIRSNGKYAYGSSANKLVKPYLYSARIDPSGVVIRADFADNTNVINNSPVGIYWSGKITFE